ncbi:MAG TPA: glutamate 5-kinase [bacterium]|jgi:glutamate 5-kinase|nr:glutamate 5-kinase [bacterium]
MALERKSHLSKVKRVVIKIGSSLLTNPKKKAIQATFLTHLATQIKTLQQKNIQCVIVTSGAIAAGFYKLGLKERPKEIAQLQALAAIGQSQLMHSYEKTFKRSGLNVAQLLLTWEDLSHRNRYSNAHNTLIELFKNKVIPVVNENDTVAVEEIKFGNNDTLGVLVTHLCEADLLIVLTDTNGLYDEDPRLNPKAKLINDVDSLNPNIEKNATSTRSAVGTGGMKTKVHAAKSMMQSGIPMVIANGKTKNVLTKILASEKVGTFFYPSSSKMNSRKRWLAWGVKPRGEIRVDEGAQKAICEKDKSLLPGGIQSVMGYWSVGEVVKVVGMDNQEIAKGIVNYSSEDLKLIKGLKTEQIAEKLGRKSADEVIHRDNLVKTESF